MIHAIFYATAAAGWIVFIWCILWPGKGHHTRPRREQREELYAGLAALARITWLYATLRLRPAMRLAAEEESPDPEPPLPGRDDPAAYERHDGVIHVEPDGTLTVRPRALHPYPLDTQTRPQPAVRDEMEPISPARGYAPQNTPEMIP
jgi:hypothetical protein